eukprot:10969745-Lingulodinium_polyedra.AAC.1
MTARRPAVPRVRGPGPRAGPGAAAAVSRGFHQEHREVARRPAMPRPPSARGPGPRAEPGAAATARWARPRR